MEVPNFLWIFILSLPGKDFQLTFALIFLEAMANSLGWLWTTFRNLDLRSFFLDPESFRV